jgi:4-hydroxyproline epimerase
MTTSAQRIRVVDSHTGGEPTRLVIGGGPDLGAGTMAERLVAFRSKHDWLRSALVNEPRGSDVIVGALLCQPQDPASAAGVIFFNNVGYLGMCGHGTIGLLATLAYLGQIRPGSHRIETTVGAVQATLHNANEVTVRNVACYRHAARVPVEIPGYGKLCGDVAWGGNWFYLIYESPLAISASNIERLTEFSWHVRQALGKQGITGAGGAEIDHIELYGPPQTEGAQSKNFVLCPGKIYDRSPCGTGTCAKLACLYADGKLKPGESYWQESVIGSMFDGSIEVQDGQIFPSVRGSAYVTGDAEMILDPSDPFRFGIRM